MDGHRIFHTARFPPHVFGLSKGKKNTSRDKKRVGLTYRGSGTGALVSAKVSFRKKTFSGLAASVFKENGKGVFYRVTEDEACEYRIKNPACFPVIESQITFQTIIPQGLEKFFYPPRRAEPLFVCFLSERIVILHKAVKIKEVSKSSSLTD